MNSNNFFSNHTTIRFHKKYLQASDDFRKSIFYLKADIPISDDVLKKRLHNKKTLSNKTIREILMQVFQRNDAKIQIISDTTLHSVYQIIFKNESYILKINSFSDVYHEMQFLQELWINKLLAFHSLPSLSIVSIDASRDYFPFDFIIMKNVTGKSLFDWKSTSKKEQEIFSNLGESVATLHSIKTKNFGPFSMDSMTKSNIGKGLHTQWRSFFMQNVDTHIDTCLLYRAINISGKKRIVKIFSANKELLANFIPCIIHNDLSARNIFIDNNNIPILVDWEDAISGDPIYDIAGFGTFCFRPEQQIRIEYFLEGYKRIRTLPSDFKKKYWLYYLRISLLKTALLARQGKDRNDLQKLRIQKAITELS